MKRRHQVEIIDLRGVIIWQSDKMTEKPAKHLFKGMFILETLCRSNPTVKQYRIVLHSFWE